MHPIAPEQTIASVMALISGTADPYSFSTIRAGGAGARYPVTIESCSRPLPAGEIEGRTVICGRVQVPEVTRSITSTGSCAAMLDFVVAYAALATQAPSRQGLRELVETRLHAAGLAQILSLIDLMTEADVRATCAAVAGDACKAHAGIVYAIDLMVIACQEHMPFNSPEGFAA